MLEQLSQRRDARPFVKPMQELWGRGVMADYRKVIKKPMDLRTVRERLRRGEYNDGGPEEFARVSKNDEFGIQNEGFVSKTRNFAFKKK